MGHMAQLRQLMGVSDDLHKVRMQQEQRRQRTCAAVRCYMCVACCSTVYGHKRLTVAFMWLHSGSRIGAVPAELQQPCQRRRTSLRSQIPCEL